MPDRFKSPDFSSGVVEFRHQEGEICIYATAEGLRRLVEFCQRLIKKPKMGHIHLEDHQVLTDDSLPGVIAILEEVPEER